MGKRTRAQSDEDLFRDTTMTFGEHLEELRMCLFKAVLGLAAGFVLGLTLSGPAVRAIEGPLTRALTAYQKKKAEESVRAKVAELREAGYPLPEDFEKDPERVETFIKSVAGKKFEEVYVNPRELLALLETAHPEQFRNLSPNVLPSPRRRSEGPGARGFGRGSRDVSSGVADSKGKNGSGGLVPVFLWHNIEKDVRVTSLGVHEPFGTFIKTGFFVGLIVASPWIFYQIWSFVAAGLYPHEKQYIHVFLPFSIGLFLAGAALAFFFVFEPVLKFLFYFNDKLEIVPDIRISDWLSFVLILPLGFGIAFQLPLVMLFLERIGVFDVGVYLSKWRIAILVIFTLAMFLTPADPYSMLLMALPLTVLYFGGILLCKYMPRRHSPFDEKDD